MNGEELPGLLNALNKWVRENRDPNTGLVFGATVSEPTDEQTMKTYGFTCDDEDKHFNVIVWQFGNVNIETSDFSKGTDKPDSELFYWEEFEFEETPQVIEKLDSLFRQNAPCGHSAGFAARVAP